MKEVLKEVAVILCSRRQRDQRQGVEDDEKGAGEGDGDVEGEEDG